MLSLEFGPIAQRVLFSIDGRDYCVLDVVRAAQVGGEWDEVARRASVEVEPRVIGDELEKAEVRFRRARRLIAGEDLRQWLAHWDMSVSEWRAFLSRELARPRVSEASRTTVDVRTVLVEAVCSGELARWMESLAQRLAVWRVCVGEMPRLPEDLPLLHDALDRFVSRAREDQRALQVALASSFLDWTRFLIERVSARREDVLREVLACVRVDSRSLRDVAAQAGLRVGGASLWLGDCERHVRDALLGARPGDVVGPLEVQSQLSVLAIIDRTAPTLKDPDVLGRAQDQAEGGARRRVVDDWVVFRAGN